MTFLRDAKRLPISLITYVGWTLITVFGMRWASDGTKKPLGRREVEPVMEIEST